MVQPPVELRRLLVVVKSSRLTSKLTLLLLENYRSVPGSIREWLCKPSPTRRRQCKPVGFNIAEDGRKILKNAAVQKFPRETATSLTFWTIHAVCILYPVFCLMKSRKVMRMMSSLPSHQESWQCLFPQETRVPVLIGLLANCSSFVA